jgi:threonine dehydratase
MCTSYLPLRAGRVCAGTVALEALEQIARLLHGEDCSDDAPMPAEAAAPGQWVPAAGAPCPLDCLVVPVGGGGLASGCATVAKALFPSLLVVGAEPLAMDDASRSKAAGCVQGNASGATTVADGLRTTLGPNTWPVVRDKVWSIWLINCCRYRRKPN